MLNPEKLGLNLLDIQYLQWWMVHKLNIKGEVLLMKNGLCLEPVPLDDSVAINNKNLIPLGQMNLGLLGIFSVFRSENPTGVAC